jgi:hypothetical protein
MTEELKIIINQKIKNLENNITFLSFSINYQSEINNLDLCFNYNNYLKKTFDKLAEYQLIKGLISDDEMIRNTCIHNAIVLNSDIKIKNHYQINIYNTALILNKPNEIHQIKKTIDIIFDDVKTENNRLNSINFSMKINPYFSKILCREIVY